MSGMAEAFEYAVQIRNVSDHPVEIPWDLRPADIEPTDPRARYQYQTAAIWLDAKLGDNRAVSMEGLILLFGTPLSPSCFIGFRHAIADDNNLLRGLQGAFSQRISKGHPATADAFTRWHRLDAAGHYIKPGPPRRFGCGQFLSKP
jgi:hypothetical protein